MEYSVGIDIGGTKIAAGIVNKSGNIVFRRSAPTPQSSRNEVLDLLDDMIQACFHYANHNGSLPLKGIGIGTAGQIDFHQGRVLSGTANIADWNDVALRDEISKITSLPVWVDNDVNVIALAEHYLGAAQAESNILFLALGTGVGGGIISEGRLIHGAWGSAGELGHLSVNMDGPECKCGFRGCLETYASGTGIANRMREKLSELHVRQDPEPEHITSQLVFQLMKSGDKIAGQVVEEMIHALSYAIVSLIHIFNPTMIVLGGGVVEDGEWIRLSVEKQVHAIGLRSMVHPVQIQLAKLGPNAGIIGAAYQSWIY
ncbi:MAG: hypothetical protein JWN30_1809 [Bacilli bacterium]|nr:hypothetical protein [Bacilli bacterium]